MSMQQARNAVYVYQCTQDVEDDSIRPKVQVEHRRRFLQLLLLDVLYYKWGSKATILRLLMHQTRRFDRGRRVVSYEQTVDRWHAL